MALNSCWPVCASLVASSTESTGGALVPRMKMAKRSMSAKPILSAWSSGSLVVLQTVVVSVGLRRLLIPCSFTYASLANDSRLAC